MSGLLATTKYTKENLKPVFYLYIHLRGDNNLPFYVGKGKGNRAFSKHSRSNHWNNVVNKYGYKVEIIYDSLIEEDAFIEEIKLIEKYSYIGMPLINKTKGGEGNTSPRTLEWRKNHSEKIKAAAARDAYKKRNYSGSNNPFWGKKHVKKNK